MKQNTIVFFCVGTGGHVLPVVNLIDDLHQRSVISKRKFQKKRLPCSSGHVS